MAQLTHTPMHLRMLRKLAKMKAPPACATNGRGLFGAINGGGLRARPTAQRDGTALVPECQSGHNTKPGTVQRGGRPNPPQLSPALAQAAGRAGAVQLPLPANL